MYSLYKVIKHHDFWKKWPSDGKFVVLFSVCIFNFLWFKFMFLADSNSLVIDLSLLLDWIIWVSVFGHFEVEK